MVSAPPDGPSGPSRTKIIALTLLADVVGCVLIVFVLPFAWTTRLVLVAVYLGLVNFASRSFLGRSG